MKRLFPLVLARCVEEKNVTVIRNSCSLIYVSGIANISSGGGMFFSIRLFEPRSQVRSDAHSDRLMICWTMFGSFQKRAFSSLNVWMLIHTDI